MDGVDGVILRPIQCCIPVLELVIRPEFLPRNRHANKAVISEFDPSETVPSSGLNPVEARFRV